MSVNKIILLGNLGKDPESKTLPSGLTLCNLSVATSERWTDKQGQKQEATEWHRVTVFGKQAESCGKYLKKGQQVYVEGRVETKKWEDKEGQTQYTTQIIARKINWFDREANPGKADTQPSFGDEPSFSPDEELPF